MRCVSLLPSATEVIKEVAAYCASPDDLQLIGRSHECDFPPEVESLPALTASKIKWTDSSDVDRQVREELAAQGGSGSGLYTVDRELMARLQPDAIVTQSLCEVCSVNYSHVCNLAAGIDPPPIMVDLNPMCLEDVIADVRRVGTLVKQPEAAEAAAAALDRRIAAAVAAVPPREDSERPCVACLEWVSPIFVGGHWTPQLVHMAGGRHPLNPPKNGGGAGSSFTVTPQQLADSEPDWIIVALCGLDEPTTVAELEGSLAKEPVWKEMRAVKEGRVLIVNGNHMFNRPGPRLVDALEFLVGLLNNKPELIPAGFPWFYYKPSEAAATAEAQAQ